MRELIAVSRVICCILLWTLSSIPTFAADPHVTPAAPPPVSVPVYDWSGLYAGIHGGAGWAKNRFSDSAGGLEPGEFTAHGAFGGAQIGYNWQRDHWLVGVELEGSLAHLARGVPTGSRCPAGFFLLQQLGSQLCKSGTISSFACSLAGGAFTPLGLGGAGTCVTAACPFGSISSPLGFGGQSGCVSNGTAGGFANQFNQFGARVHAIELLTGRIGYAWGRSLLFVKVGGAVVRETYVLNAPEVLSERPTDNRFGWIVGAGVEYGLTPRWSAKLEYNYVDLGNERLQFSNANAAFVIDHSQQIHLVKAGINYRF